MDSAHAGGLGGTYGGNPISLAAAHAVLDVIESEGLYARAAKVGATMRARLERLATDVPAIGDVRGVGAMVAFELVTDRQTREPDAKLTSAIVAEAEKRGLILLSCGTAANVVRLLSPLTIQDNILEEGLNILAEAVYAATGRSSETRAVA